MGDTDPIILERDGDVAIISLNRPEKLNAIHAGAIEDFKRLDRPGGPVPDLPLEMLTCLPLRTPHPRRVRTRAAPPPASAAGSAR